MARIFFILIFLFQSTLMADEISFSNLSAQDLEKVVNDFSGNFTYTTVSGASALGSIFGFEVGVIAGIAQTPEVEKLVKSTDPNSEVSGLPHAGLIGQLTIPFGITGEVMLVPSMNAPDGEFQSTGMALKWTFTDVLLPIPIIDLALRAHMTSTKFEYSQVVGVSSQTVTFDDKVTGLQLLAGLDIPIVKPYVGIGTLSAEGDLGVTGSTSLFNFTNSTKATSKVSSSHILVGAELNMFILRLGLEYAQLFDTDRYTFKLALGF